MKSNQIARLGVIVVVIAAVAAVLRLKAVESSSPIDHAPGSIRSMVLTDQPGTTPPDARPDDGDSARGTDSTRAGGYQDPAGPAVADVALPRLLDLGADKCIPCKRMAPILALLREDFAGQFDVVFIDVWKNRQAAGPYGIKLIPTQIFFDEEGDELFRHEGFLSREDILATWSELGYVFGASPGGEPG